jgi:hypothetical protein
MIPLLVTGAVSLASDAIHAWQEHSATAAATKAVGQAANSADFQASLKDAATKLAAANQQQQVAAAPGELKAATEEILQSPGMQTMARYSANGTVNLQFDSSGNVFASTVGGKPRAVNVSTDVRQQLSQLNALMRTPQAGLGNTAVMTEQLTSSHLPVQVSLSAV